MNVFVRFVDSIKIKLKHVICKDELAELYRIKTAIEDVKVWCSSEKQAVAISKYLQNKRDYPCQLQGCHGSIEDFRYYLKGIDSKKSNN